MLICWTCWSVPTAQCTRDGDHSTRVHREVRSEICAYSAGPYPSRGHGIGPGQPSGGDQQPGHRIGLHHIGRCAAGVPRPGDTLNRTERWNTDLHRSARRGPRQLAQERAHGVTQHRSLRFGALVQRVQRGADGLGFIVRRRHVGTIRPRIEREPGGPGSRRAPTTGHSGRRCVLVAGSIGHFEGSPRPVRPGRRWT